MLFKILSRGNNVLNLIDNKNEKVFILFFLINFIKWAICKNIYENYFVVIKFVHVFIYL